jgi:precorrin-4/cobalt-precorrin-4 C11-methyltransferase
LADTKERCCEAGILGQAMVIASPTLGARHWPELAKSKLYDASCAHHLRRASAPKGTE